MRRIWKFRLAIQVKKQTILMPRGANIISVGWQQTSSEASLSLWAIVDPSATKERREFVTVGTGQDIADHPGIFVGTAVTYGGEFVWHVFESAPARPA